MSWKKKIGLGFCVKLNAGWLSDGYGSICGGNDKEVKVKVTLEQTAKAQTGSRGIAALFLQPRC